MRTSTVLAVFTVLFQTAFSSPVSIPIFRRQGSCNGTSPSNSTSTTITIARGDTLSKLAERFGTGICDIAAANNLTNINLIEPGQTLVIPAPSCNPDNASCLPPPAPPVTATCVLGGPDRFVAQDGLSLEQTAQFLKITMDAFTQANAATIKDGGNPTAGQILNVPVCPGSSCKISPATIQQGDIFDEVAAKAGSTTGQILALNPGIDRLALQVGQTFTLPSECKAA